ncbi:serine/threonine protein kinase [Myxococcota bacterium]|nr:serine/threonine protein kinase [Myxococcota bacterium]
MSVDLVCPRCRRTQAPQDGRRCPVDKAYFVTRAALAAAGRDAYLGELIGNRYAVLERLGMGGMGAVYRGRDEKTGDRVAVKFLRDEYSQHKAIRARFVREAEAGVSIDSPFVVGMLDFGVDADHTLYIVMEYCEGWTLRDEVNNNGPFSVRHARELARQMLRGLADAHDVGLIHRDLKHDNIMFEGSRDRFTARILDFGVVKIDAEDTREDGRVLTAAGAMVGSPSYMAPEQIRGLQVGPPADLYALAVVLYEAMTARRLFPVNNYEALLRTTAKRDAPPLLVTGSGEVVPPELNRILQTALAHDPKDRYPDARTMLLAIEQMDMGVHAGPLDLFSDAPGTGQLRRPPELRLVTPPGATPAARPMPAASPPAADERAPTPDLPDLRPPTPPEALAAPFPSAPGESHPRAPRFRPDVGAGLYAASAVVAYALTRMMLP